LREEEKGDRDRVVGEFMGISGGFSDELEENDEVQ
jgi:hypothetical protein